MRPRPVEMPRARAFVVAVEFPELVTGGEIRTFAVLDADFRLLREIGVVEQVEPAYFAGIFHPEHFQVAGVDVDEPSPVVVDLDADGGVLDDVAQQFFLLIQCLVRRYGVGDVEDQDHNLASVVGRIVQETAAMASGFFREPFVGLVIAEADVREFVDMGIDGVPGLACRLAYICVRFYPHDLLRRAVDREKKVVDGASVAVVKQPDAEISDRQVVEQHVHMLVFLYDRVVVVFERQDFCFAPVVHGNALHVAEKVRTRCGVGLPSDELGVEPDFALGKFDRERPVKFAVDLERHEFVVDRHPVVFANQVCQLPDPDFVAVEPQQLGDIFGDMQFAGLEIRFPPTHVGGVQHEHQGLEIRGVGCEHGAMGCLGIFRAGG